MPWHQSQLSSLCGDSGHLVHPGIVSQPCRSPQPSSERQHHSRATAVQDHQVLLANPQMSPFSDPSGASCSFEQSPRNQQKLLHQLLLTPGVLQISMYELQLTKPPLSKMAVEVNRETSNTFLILFKNRLKLLKSKNDTMLALFTIALLKGYLIPLFHFVEYVFTSIMRVFKASF